MHLGCFYLYMKYAEILVIEIFTQIISGLTLDNSSQCETILCLKGCLLFLACTHKMSLSQLLCQAKIVAPYIFTILHHGWYFTFAWSRLWADTTPYFTLLFSSQTAEETFLIIFFTVLKISAYYTVISFCGY